MSPVAEAVFEFAFMAWCNRDAVGDDEHGDSPLATKWLLQGINGLPGSNKFPDRTGRRPVPPFKSSGTSGAAGSAVPGLREKIRLRIDLLRLPSLSAHFVHQQMRLAGGFGQPVFGAAGEHDVYGFVAANL